MRQKVVSFKNTAHLPPLLLQRLTEAAAPLGIEDVHPFSPEEIVVAEWVQLKCRYGCDLYNRSWCCPPATPTPEKVREIISEYSAALLLQSTHYLPNFYNDHGRRRASLVRCWKGTVSLERMLFLEGYHKAFSLVGESCALCKKCVYPRNCRFPKEKRPSVESFSIDVIGTLQRLGITPKLATDIQDPFKYYAIILVI
jgi:predicted metal-binding protein